MDELLEAAQEAALVDRAEEIAPVVADRLAGQRERRAGLDAAAGPDVKAQPERGRADRFARRVPIGVDQDDRMLAAQAEQPAAKLIICSRTTQNSGDGSAPTGR